MRHGRCSSLCSNKVGSYNALPPKKIQLTSYLKKFNFDFEFEQRFLNRSRHLFTTITTFSKSNSSPKSSFNPKSGSNSNSNSSSYSNSDGRFKKCILKAFYAF